MSSFCWQFSCWNGWAAVGWNRIWPFFSWSVSTYKVLLKIRHKFQVINFYCRECCIKKQAKEHTDEHTALCLITRSKFSCSCGLPQFFIHRLHFSSSVFGLGNKINRLPFSRSGYLSSALHVPHAMQNHLLLRTGYAYNQLACLWDKMAATPTLSCDWLVFTLLIDRSEL